jgi:penicillin-binding protein 1A
MAAVVQRASAMGIEGNIPPELAVSLGAYEVTPIMMAKAYSSFAGGGKRTTPRLIISVKDTWGQELVVNEPEKVQAITPQNAFIMTSLLKEVVNAGTATKARALNRPIAGKTGTTNDERDAWFIGFTPYLVTSIYTGYDQVRSLGRLESGSRTALPAFVYYFQEVEDRYPPSDFTRPGGIVLATVDAANGKLAGPNTVKSFSLPFFPGTEPKEHSGYQTVEESGESLLRQF